MRCLFLSLENLVQASKLNVPAEIKVKWMQTDLQTQSDKIRGQISEWGKRMNL